MTPERRNPIDDDTLDAAIRTTLAVEPSPAFRARVRERIAAEPVREGWGWSWKVAGLAAAAAVAGLVAFVSLTDRKPVTPEVATVAPVTNVPEPAAPAVRPVEPPATPSVASVTDSPAAMPRGEVRRGVAVQAARPVSSEPEILLDQRELVAFRQLIRSLDPERVDLRTIQREMPSADNPLPLLAALAVQPVVVTPLPSLND